MGVRVAAAAPRVRALEWDGRRLRLLDQTRLPAEEVWLEPRTGADVVDAISRLAVRGAPLIGVAAGFGLALDAAADPEPEALERSAAALRAARPTAANLGRAVDRVAAAARS